MDQFFEKRKQEVADTYPIPGSRYVGGYMGVGLQNKTKKQDNIHDYTGLSQQPCFNSQLSMIIDKNSLYVLMCFYSPTSKTEI